MNNPTRYSLFVGLVMLLPASLISARPLDFKEVSLLVRVHEPESSIRDEVAQRRLLHALTPQQEATLKAQGASDSLVSSLRNSNLVVSKEEAAAIEAPRRERAISPNDLAQSQSGPQVHVFNVAFGHPVNLSQWGGLDYEIAFYSYRFAGEDHIQSAFVDQIGTRTEVSRTIPLLSEGETFTQNWYPTNSVRSWRYTPYDSRNDTRDQRLNFSDSVSVTSYSIGRPTDIDWDNPVFFKGEAYTFYPVYGTAGVSLYYIGRASDTSAKVAVVQNFR